MVFDLSDQGVLVIIKTFNDKPFTFTHPLDISILRITFTFFYSVDILKNNFAGQTLASIQDKVIAVDKMGVAR